MSLLSKPRDARDPRYGFFYPTLTLMMDSYILHIIQIISNLENARIMITNICFIALTLARSQLGNVILA